MATAQAETTLDALRELGARIKQSLVRTDSGIPPTSADVVAMQTRLRQIEANSDGTASGATKDRAIAALLEQLRFELAQPPANRSFGGSNETEIVSAARGSQCENALGLTESSNVAVSLRAGGDAWFVLPASDSPHVRIGTDSAGPDPALQVYGGCGAKSRLIGANDDAFGLDAALTLNAAAGHARYVHLTNAGIGGRIVVSATAATMTVSGHVEDVKTGQPISNANVQVSPASGGFEASTWTDSFGNYSVAVPDAGTYYVYAAAQGYIAQAYLNDDCNLSPSGFYGCDLSMARTVSVSAQSSPTNINFSLSPGQRISGQLRGTNNVPTVGQLMLYNTAGGSPIFINTDAVGHYSFSTVGKGTYQLQAQASGYGSQMYDHVNCDGPTQTSCNLSKADTFAVGTHDVEIDFSLTVLGSIHGTIATSSGAPLNNNSGTQIVVYDGYGNYIATSNSDYNADTYTVAGLAPGNYFVVAQNDSYFMQLNGGVDCATNCMSEMATATPITLTSYGQQVETDFALDPLPELHGHVEDATTHAPVANVTVILSPAPPSQNYYGTVSGTTDATGYYVVRNVPGGSYYAWAVSPDHVDQIYPDITCEQTQNSNAQCDVGTATRILSAPNTAIPDANFSLMASGSISGSVSINAGPGSDLPAVTLVNVYDTTGANVASANSDALGHYVVSDIPQGNYTVAAGVGGSFFPQLWQNIACPLNGCIPTQGTMIPVGAAQNVTGIDFVLTRAYSVSGRVTDANGIPILGVAVDLFDGSGVLYGSGISDAEGYYAALSNAPGQFYATTEAGGGYVDQVYSGIQCPQGTVFEGKCSLAGGTVIAISGTSTLPHIVNFALGIGDRLFGNGFE